MTPDAELDYQIHWAARGTLLSIRDRDEGERDFPKLAKLIAACYPARLADILNAPVAPAEPSAMDFATLILG